MTPESDTVDAVPLSNGVDGEEVFASVKAVEELEISTLSLDHY